MPVSDPQSASGGKKATASDGAHFSAGPGITGRKEWDCIINRAFIPREQALANCHVTCPIGTTNSRQWAQLFLAPRELVIPFRSTSPTIQIVHRPLWLVKDERCLCEVYLSNVRRGSEAASPDEIRSSRPSGDVPDQSGTAGPLLVADRPDAQSTRPNSQRRRRCARLLFSRSADAQAPRDGREPRAHETLPRCTSADVRHVVPPSADLSGPSGRRADSPRHGFGGVCRSRVRPPRVGPSA